MDERQPGTESSKPLRWTQHAIENLVERRIARERVEACLAAPESRQPDRPDREIPACRYYDRDLSQGMLLRVVIEETADEVVVITVYKTSRLAKYLKGIQA